MMSHAVAWRGGCAAASVTSNRIGSIYWLGYVFFCSRVERASSKEKGTETKTEDARYNEKMAKAQ
jgi:hypothetical protein